jgi:hypothetical protein
MRCSAYEAGNVNFISCDTVELVLLQHTVYTCSLHVFNVHNNHNADNSITMLIIQKEIFTLTSMSGSTLLQFFSRLCTAHFELANVMFESWEGRFHTMYEQAVAPFTTFSIEMRNSCSITGVGNTIFATK